MKAVLLTGLFALSWSGGVLQEKLYKGWSLERERAHIRNRENSDTWDLATLEGDKEAASFQSDRPIAQGIFPVPKYDLVGTRSFRGCGTMRTHFDWKGRHLHGNAFFNKRSPVNEKWVGKLADEVFFQILVLSDVPVGESPKDASSSVFSRNHPHIVGMGFYRTSVADIEYFAFVTAQRQQFALVGSRLFDLRAGRVVIIAPQKDGTLRSLQVDAPLMSSSQVQKYEASLLRSARVRAFLDASGNL